MPHLIRERDIKERSYGYDWDYPWCKPNRRRSFIEDWWDSQPPPPPPSSWHYIPGLVGGEWILEEAPAEKQYGCACAKGLKSAKLRCLQKWRPTCCDEGSFDLEVNDYSEGAFTLAVPRSMPTEELIKLLAPDPRHSKVIIHRGKESRELVPEIPMRCVEELATKVEVTAKEPPKEKRLIRY